MTHLTDIQHDEQMADMRAFDEQMPCVGIFWYNLEDNTLFGVRKQEVTPKMVEEAAEKGLPFINYPHLHRQVWAKEFFKAQATHEDTKATGLSPRQAWLDLPKEGPPGLWVIFFSRTQLPCPAPAQPRHPTSTCPQPVVTTPAPRWKGGERAWRGKEVVCACLLPWPKHCAIWQSEDAFAGFQE